MKLIIAGSRGFLDYPQICETLDDHKLTKATITEVVSDCTGGADKLGERWAVSNGIPVRRLKADQALHGKYAEVIRDAEMVEYADACIVFWDGASKGPKHLIDLATAKQGMRLLVVTAQDIKLVDVVAALKEQA